MLPPIISFQGPELCKYLHPTAATIVIAECSCLKFSDGPLNTIIIVGPASVTSTLGSLKFFVHIYFSFGQK